jgi:hypothetical protein
MVMTRLKWIMLATAVSTGAGLAGCVQEHVRIGGHGEGAEEDNDAAVACVSECDDAAAGIVGNPAAFRVTAMSLQDPHLHARSFFLCIAATETTNEGIQNAIDELEFNLVIAFDPLEEINEAVHPATVWHADCTSPTSCSAAVSPEPSPTVHTYQSSGTCMAPVAGQVHFGDPSTVDSPCFATAPTSLALGLFGTVIPLQDAQLGGTFASAHAVTSGLLRGFLDEATAEAVVLDLDGFSGTLHSLLPPNRRNDTDARNTHNGQEGWWVHFNFEAERVTDPTGF